MSLKDPDKKKAYQKAWYEKNKERILSSRRRYYNDNYAEIQEYHRKRHELYRDRFNKKSADYRAKNLDRTRKAGRDYYAWLVEYDPKGLREKRKQARDNTPTEIRRKWEANYRENNREIVRERAREWARRNRHKTRAKCQERRAKQRGCTIGDPSAIIAWEKSWRQMRRVRCYWCNRMVSPKNAHADHIMPISRGGSHSISNLAIACAACNLSKGAKPIEIWNGKIEQPVLNLDLT